MHILPASQNLSLFLKRHFFLLFLLTISGFGYSARNNIKAISSKSLNEPNRSTTINAIPSTTKDEKKFESLPLPANPFGDIDKQIRSCPKSEEKSITTLAAFLQKNTSTNLQKARAIYVWITHNISYDDQAFNSGIHGDYSAEDVLKNKKSLCGGFSTLFLALGKKMNLEIEKVTGYSKGYGYSPSKRFKDTDHAWNIIKIDGQWKVFDATWGSGSIKIINGQLLSKKEFNEYWFNVSPYAAVFSHLPQNSSFTMVQPAIDLNTYEKFPVIDKEYFRLGFDAEDTYRHLRENNALLFPKCYPTGTYAKALVAPKYELLYANRSYDFEFYIPKGISVVVVDARNNWTYFTGAKGKFKLLYTPKVPGELQVSVKYENGEDSFYTMMIYTVQ